MVGGLSRRPRGRWCSGGPGLDDVLLLSLLSFKTEKLLLLESTINNSIMFVEKFGKQQLQQCREICLMAYTLVFTCACGLYGTTFDSNQRQPISVSMSLPDYQFDRGIWWFADLGLLQRMMHSGWSWAKRTEGNDFFSFWLVRCYRISCDSLYILIAWAEIWTTQ